MNATQKTQIRRLSRNLADGHIDESGCVDMTTLAEEIADRLKIDSELDDETSDLWTIGCHSRLLVEPEEKLFLVCDYTDDDEEVIIYEGSDFDTAWTVLTARPEQPST